MRLLPMARAAIPTGISVAIPEGFEGQIRPRSGLSFRLGISIPNAPGTIDSDYRGELKAILINLGEEPFEITRGMRIAQLVIAPCVQMPMEITTSLDETVRGEGRFGSTGKES